MNGWKICCSEVSSAHGHPGYAPFDLKEVAESIRCFGVLQPRFVRPDGRGHEVVHGERCPHTARLAGLTWIPAEVVEEAGNDSDPPMAA
jgi:ParB-like chromosome segregation protein Spo0J